MIYVARSQVNVRLDGELVEGVEELVRSGRFPTKTEAFSEALRLLLRVHRGKELASMMDDLREGTGGLPSLSGSLAASRREEEEPVE